MSASPATRRAVAEIDFGDGAAVSFKVGNRSIHQFWHLFSSHFRHVLLASQRRADSGKVAWTWREAGEKRPVTATELVEVRRRLAEANRSLAGGFGGMGRADDDEASSLEGQVRDSVGEMINQLLAQRDSALAGFVCRTDAGLMLHSWGAAVAAQPYFPDAQPGEISGTVFAGIERPAGISVVLENTQGIGGARVKSDKDGGFCFPNVAPGSYRIRVADRSDFPGGLTVEIERESIAGLELRSASDEPLSMAGKITPVAEDVPWFRRRRTGLILLLLILGAGSLTWWWSKRSSDTASAAQNQSSSWQSAKGQLAANNPQTSAYDDHKVGLEGAPSTLSNSIPPPKVLPPRHDRAPSEADGVASDPASQPAEDSTGPGQRVPEEKSPADDSNGKPTPRTPAPQVHAAREPLNSSSGNAEEKVRPSEDGPGAVLNGDEVKSAKDKLAKFPRRAADKKKAGTPGVSSPAGDESPDEDAALAGSNAAADSETSTAAASSGGKSSKPGTAKSPAATGTTAKAEAAGSNADAGAPDSSTPGPGAAANGRLKSSPDNKAKESAKSTTTNGAAVRPAESSGSASTADTPDDTTSLEGGASKSAPKNPPTSKTVPPNQAPPQPESSTAPSQEDTGSSAAPDPTASSNKKTKQPSVAAEKKSVPPKQTNDSPTSTAEAEGDQSPAVQASDAANGLPASKRPVKSPKKSRSTPASSPAADEQPDSPPAQNPTMSSLPISSERPKATEEDRLTQVTKIHVSAWHPRVMRDAIVPTRPLTAGEEESLETMRQKIRQERLTRLPTLFQDPQTKNGLIFYFPDDASGKPELPRWRDEPGREVVGSSVRSGMAELGWSGPAVANGANYVLGYENGMILVRVRVNEAGEMVVKAGPSVRIRYWIGLETASIEAATSPAFDWRLSTGEAIPPTWRRDDHWLGDRGLRVEVPLDETSRRVGHYGVCLVDPPSGWALACDLALQ